MASEWPMFVTTNSMQKFWYLEPERYDIDVEDFACGFSKACRFCNQLTEHYSVAQHSVLVSYIVPDAFALAALFHECAEFVMGDMSSVLKQLCPEFKRIEKRIEAALFPKLAALYPKHDMSYPLDPIVKVADRIMLKAEHRQLLGNHTYVDEYMPDVTEYAATIYPLGHQMAKSLWLARLQELTR